jgi:uncharacterized membrane protein (UPF0127 family)
LHPGLVRRGVHFWRCDWEIVTLTKPNGEVIARPKVLRRWWERARGFMFRRKLEPGEALLFVNPRENVADAAIHMLFVGMPLSVVWLDSEWRVVDTVLAQPWQRTHYAPQQPAKYILEGSPTLLEQTRIGDYLMWG